MGSRSRFAMAFALMGRFRSILKMMLGNLKWRASRPSVSSAGMGSRPPEAAEEGRRYSSG